jgi:S-adenosylmethionine hydrolase
MSAMGRISHASAVELAATAFQLQPVSKTFHGRDVFAPAAAHLAAGLPLSRLGPQIQELNVLRAAEPEQTPDGYVATVVHVDRFGNLITNLNADLAGNHPVVEAGHAQLQGLSATYRDGPLVALRGSGGMLEIAARDGSAAAALRLHIGDRIRITIAP